MNVTPDFTHGVDGVTPDDTSWRQFIFFFNVMNVLNCLSVLHKGSMTMPRIKGRADRQRHFRCLIAGIEARPRLYCMFYLFFVFLKGGWMLKSCEMYSEYLY